MNGVNKTLYIPLYGKALVSKKGVILQDKKAEDIWQKENFKLKGKAKSKWLAYYMGMRSAVFDSWVLEKIEQNPNAVVLHLGCGLDSRVERLNCPSVRWYDVDFETVINERRKYYLETENYKMICADLKDSAFLATLPKAESAIIVMEGVSMYLTNFEITALFSALKEKFTSISILVDCYTPFAVKMSKIKNPVNQVGVLKVYGVENPTVLEKDTGVKFCREREITPQDLIEKLQGFERVVFKKIYAGGVSKKLYKLYEYES